MEAKRIPLRLSKFASEVKAAEEAKKAQEAKKKEEAKSESKSSSLIVACGTDFMIDVIYYNGKRISTVYNSIAEMEKGMMIVVARSFEIKEATLYQRLDGKTTWDPISYFKFRGSYTFKEWRPEIKRSVIV